MWNHPLFARIRWALVVVTATALVPAQAQDIVVGQIGPFTVLPVPDAKQVNEGIKAHLAQVNAAGGVGGRRVSLFEVDDK